MIPASTTRAARPPSIELGTLDGHPLEPEYLRGKVIVVNVRATWGERRIEEMPSMQRRREKSAAEALEILAVDFQEGGPGIRGFKGRASRLSHVLAR